MNHKQIIIIILIITAINFLEDNIKEQIKKNYNTFWKGQIIGSPWFAQFYVHGNTYELESQFDFVWLLFSE